MTEISRPDFTYQWSSGGAIVAPSNVKIQTGWTAEVPPFQWENWSQNRQDNALVHIFQKGISVWSATQDYYFAASAPKAFVQGSDGLIYEAVQSSTNQNPTTDTTNTYWRLAFKNQSGAPVYALDTGTANTYKADYVPVVKTLVDGMVLRFKALNANTGASTFTPANGVIPAAPIVGSGHTALPSGVISANGDVWLQWNTSVAGGSWVMVASTGVNTPAGRLLRVTTFSNSGTFTPGSGTTAVKVRGVGGGGAGGGAPATASGQVSVASGGGGGAYGEGFFTGGFSAAVVTIGPAGVGALGIGGGPGGASSFGALITFPGGLGGTVTGPSAPPFPPTGAGGAGAGTGGYLNSGGGPAGVTLATPGCFIGSQGGNSVLGAGGGAAANGAAGVAASGPGGGGGGTSTGGPGSPALTGGAGGKGIIIVEEYGGI